MKCAIQVVGASSGIVFRPEELDRLLFQQAPLDSQALEERRCLAPCPGGGVQDTISTCDFEATKQENAHRTP